MRRKPKKAKPLWGHRSVRRHYVMWRARGFEYENPADARERADYFGASVERVVRSFVAKDYRERCRRFVFHGFSLNCFQEEQQTT